VLINKKEEIIGFKRTYENLIEVELWQNQEFLGCGKCFLD